jgi:hypothetical protein
LRQLGILFTLMLSAGGSQVQALCWGSLYVVWKGSTLQSSCPIPTLTKTWRIRCYDGCGYSDGSFSRYLSGYGQCFKAKNCRRGAVCLPLSGSDIRGFNPPSLSSSTVDRRGYYASPPCSLPSCRTAGVSTMTVVCDCDDDFSPAWCAQNDPVIVSLSDNRYQLTDRAGGVPFDLGGTGAPTRVPWTDPAGDEALLALDRDASGAIDDGAELFGDVTPQHASDRPNGFRALAMFDDLLSGGNEDGRISDGDAIFRDLVLWIDRNHNGFSEPEELLTLPEAGLESIGLDYQETRRVDRHGNEFRYLAEAVWADGSRRRLWNVFLLAD